MSQEEREYYRAGDVLVTNTRAGLGGRTFAMANITAVSMGTRVNSLRGCAFVLLYVGVVLAVVALAAGGSGGVAGFLGGAAGFLVGLLIVWLVYGWLKSLKSFYSVHISSASGESRAMESHNKEEIERIVAAIKQAIIERG